ncbi:MAG: alpha/beta fold hydrolase [Anaerolineales bacterium]
MAGRNMVSPASPSPARRMGRIMIIAAAVMLALLFIVLGLLVMWSPGNARPLVDAKGRPQAGSISEKIRVDINGVPQGMFIKSNNAANPVLLFVHGGPGMPEYFLTDRYPTGLEDNFTVCWWEQRGAGLSHTPDVTADTMTVDQFVSDTLAVTNYLRARFDKDKIYLMAHSGGTLIGIEAAKRAPELFYAYIGVAQITHQIESEGLAYDYMLAQFRENGNTGMVRRLEAAGAPNTIPLPPAYDGLRDEAMHGLGIGTTHEMRSVVSGIFLPSLQFPEYTLGEKINLWRGKTWSKSLLWDTVLATDLRQQVPALDLPTYFIHGAYDYTVSYVLAQSYFAQLEAPLKGFYTFEQSAHSPMFEEPGKLTRILREDVLEGTNNLADAR